MFKIQYNTKVNKDNDIVFDIVNDFVIYYDKDNDIIIVNDIVKVFDKDYDNDNVNDLIKDNDFVKILQNEYQSPNNLIRQINKVYDLINKSYDLLNVTTIKNNKYVNDIDIDKGKVKDIVNDLLNDNNKFLLDYNSNIIDIDNDIVKDLINNIHNDFTILSMNKDLFNNICFDFKDLFLLSYVNYNYDNDNVKVIIKSKDKDYVLKNINYDNMPLKLQNTKNFYINQINKNSIDFENLKYQYFNCKDNKQRQRLIKIGNNKQRQIKRFNDKLSNLNENIIELPMIKQYIIKNNCYFNDLNKLTNLVYKSFKNVSLDFVLKDKINDIDKDNVNKSFKYDFDKDNDNDKDNVFDLFIYENSFFNNYDNDKVFVKIDKDNVFDFDIDFKELVKDYDKDIDLLLKDISYNLVTNCNFNVLKDIDFDLVKYDMLLNEYTKELDLCLKELKDIDIDIDNDKDIDNDNVIVKEYNLLKDIINNITNYVIYLNCINDFVNDLKDKDNNNDTNINDYDFYNYDIFKSHLNKHNSIIKTKESDFLKVAFNENRTNFCNID